MIIREFNPSQSKTLLEEQIDMEISHMGFHLNDDTRLADFILGAADEVGDEEDHWSNYRPY